METLNRDQFEALGDTLKAKEELTKTFLDKSQPVIIRLDGKAFHTYTRGFDKPFDTLLVEAFTYTCQKLCKEIMNCKIAFTQSDEITLFINSYTNPNGDLWFGGNIQKITSVSASLATGYFNQYIFTNLDKLDTSKRDLVSKKMATFDSRVFQVSTDEVNSVFVWRQTDAIRNSISALAQSIFSSKQLDKVNNADKIIKLKESGNDWNDLPLHLQRGYCIVKNSKEVLMTIPEGPMKGQETLVMRSEWIPDYNVPVFNQEPLYINKYV